MKLKDCKVKTKVLFFGASDGGYYSGKTAVIVKPSFKEGKGEEAIEGFVTIKITGAGDILPAHPKQLRKKR